MELSIKKALTESEKQNVITIIDKNGRSTDKLLNVLLEIQQSLAEKYIGEEVANIVADEMNMKLVDVYDVLTFYEMLSTAPSATYKVELCKCAPCYINDSESIQSIVEEELGIKVGEHTEDNLFELEHTQCVGACYMGPIMKIGETIYGHLTKEVVTEIIAKYRTKGEA